MCKGHRTLGKRRWDEAIQKLAMTETHEEMPWQRLTEDRILWNSLEIKLRDGLLRQSSALRSERAHEGRWLAEPGRDVPEGQRRQEDVKCSGA